MLIRVSNVKCKFIITENQHINENLD